MSNSSAPVLSLGERYWAVLLARAVPAAILAIVITFTADHSAILGHIGLGLFAIVSGLVLVLGNVRMLAGVTRSLLLSQGAVLIVGGLLTLVTSGSGLPFLLFLVSALFAVTGLFELLAGLRSRGYLVIARDWIFVGGLSMLFAAAVLFIPVDYSQAISIPGKEVPNLTASVILVGALGAYAAIVAVYLVIAGLSLMWAKQPSGASAASTTSEA